MRTTITLFMFVSFCAWFVGNTYLVPVRPRCRPARGIGLELYYIVAAVIGGCLLTGGYGSAIGATVGALIIGMTQQGIVYAQLEHRLVQAVPRRDAAARRARPTSSSASTPNRAGSDDMTATTTTPSPAADERSNAEPLLEIRGVSKIFGSVISLKDISTTVRAGQVTCVLGDNGAGKSTFIKMLSGVHQPDEGELLMDGKPVHFHLPA